MRAVRWQPMELSLVPMGADAAAQVRGRPEMFQTEIEDIDMETHVADPAVVAAADPVTTGTITLQDVTIRSGPPDKPVPAPEPDPEPVDDPQPVDEPVTIAEPAVAVAARAAIDLERARCSGINLTARKLHLDQRHADKLIADGVALDVARERLIDLNHDQHKETAVNNVVITRDEGEVKGRALVDALLFRVGQQRQPTEAVRQYGYQYMSLIDMARECLESQGVRTRGLPPMKIADMSCSRWAAGVRWSAYHLGLRQRAVRHHQHDLAGGL